MLGRTTGAVLIGVDARPVHVEVFLTGGLPIVSAVGLAGSAVREGLDRVRSALVNSDYELPTDRTIVNLAPADLPKHGVTLDLPIAVGMLLARELIRLDTRTTMLVGELALDGGLRPIRGALAFAMLARACGKRRIVVPARNAAEAALVEGIEVIGVKSLRELAAWSSDDGRLRPVPASEAGALLQAAQDESIAEDLSDVRGQSAGRRALEISAAGGHHLLFSGSPGSGKTMLARRLPGIQPPLALEEALVVTRVWSAAGLTDGLVTRRPFRAPHHGISFAGLTGGGQRIRPGEITLASHGVLFLDELPEFRRDALEALRQPLEEGRITVVRLHASATMPAPFTLVASMNPCPCGWHGAPGDRCRCTPPERKRYASRVSGPLLDRFDLFVEVPPADLQTMGSRGGDEASAVVRERVVAARERQRERFGKRGPTCNARMSPADLDRHAVLDAESRKLLLAACRKLGFSARGFDRVRRVARTLADLEGLSAIGAHHVAEALRYRRAGE